MQAKTVVRIVGRVLVAVGILASMMLAGAAPSDFANGAAPRTVTPSR